MSTIDDVLKQVKEVLTQHEIELNRRVLGEPRFYLVNQRIRHLERDLAESENARVDANKSLESAIDSVRGLLSENARLHSTLEKIREAIASDAGKDALTKLVLSVGTGIACHTQPNDFKADEHYRLIRGFPPETGAK